MSELVDLDRDRLGKLLGMLGSDHDGEVAAAGRAADSIVRKAGLRWTDVIAPPQLPDFGGAYDAFAVFENVREAIDYCLTFRSELTPWEIGFCRSVYQQRRPPSPKQFAVLRRIVEKLATS